MLQEVEALLALQEDDLKIREIDNQIRSLDPQLAELDKKRDQAAAALTRAQTLIQAEEKKQRELQGRLAQHKQMQERNLHQLEDVKRMREASGFDAGTGGSRARAAGRPSGDRGEEVGAPVAAPGREARPGWKGSLRL